MSKRKLKLDEKTKSILIISGIIIAAISLLLMLSNLYLGFNFLVGNDVLIDLRANTESINLIHGETKNVEFIASVKTNPFCEADCSYSFNDISNDIKIASEEFKLRPAINYKKDFKIAPDQGTGSKLYRFEMKCSSKENFWCKTKQENRTRNIVITANFELNQTEIEAKAETKEDIESLITQSKSLLNRAKENDANAISINNFLIIDYEPQTSQVQSILNKIKSIITDWENENYLDINTIPVQLKAEEVSLDILNSESSLRELIQRYNSVIFKTKEISSELTLKNIQVFNETLLENINNSIDTLNKKIPILKTREYLEEIESEIYSPLFEIENNMNLITQEWNTIKQNKTNQINWNYNIICNETNECYGPINSSKLCENIDFQRELIVEFNLSNHENITLIETCNLTNITFKDIVKINISELSWQKINDSPLDIFIEEPKPKCCILNDCSACSENKGKPPIIVVHGHAFNDNTHPDYSLDSFESLTEKLESELGIVSLGRISLYNYLDLSRNLWGKFDKQFSIKVSYYFDIFGEGDINIIVPTKNENIDTYAIRLKDTIDTILQTTNSEKAIIIAHSMGGLVTRRYIQIFGPGNVEKLILVTVPNKGTYGTVADLCPILGEKLECRDMKAGSLFLNKLNREQLPIIPILNIVGLGCNEKDEDGDGIVLEKSAVLEGAENIYIEGSCQGVELLHNDILDPKKYPEMFEAISDFMQE